MNKLLTQLAVGIVILGSVLTSTSNAQTASKSDPSCFLTLSARGATTSYFGLVPRAVTYSSTSETVSGNVITDNDANLTADQFNGANGSYFVEIISIGGSTTASAVGITYVVTGTSAKSLPFRLILLPASLRPRNTKSARNGRSVPSSAATILPVWSAARPVART